MRPKIQLSGLWGTGKGEARTALLEGTEAGAAGSIIKASGVGAKDRQRLIQRTAVYGPVRTVVWEGRSREAPPYPDSIHVCVIPIRYTNAEAGVF